MAEPGKNLFPDQLLKILLLGGGIRDFRLKCYPGHDGLLRVGGVLPALSSTVLGRVPILLMVVAVLLTAMALVSSALALWAVSPYVSYLSAGAAYGTPV